MTRAEPPRGVARPLTAAPVSAHYCSVANRLLSLIDGPRDVILLHAPGLALEVPGVRMVPQSPMPPRGSWRSFDDGRTGGSKGAFLRFAASSSYDLLWQIEEDAFYTGKWQALFDELAAVPADLLASFHTMPAGPLVAAPPWWLRDCAVGAAPCFAPPAPLRKTMWSIVRVSRSYAASLVAALDAGRARGHMEALAAPFCRATAGCVAASIPHEHVGLVTTGGWGAFSDGAAANATTLEGIARIAAPHALQSDRLYHPVKCRTDERSGVSALRWGGLRRGAARVRAAAVEAGDAR